MRLPLFKAAFRYQWVSMTVYGSILFLYGILIMLAFLSIQGSVNDPNATAEGLTVTNVGKDASGYDTMNLTWETEAGVSYHIALGIANLTSIEPLMDQTTLDKLISGELLLTDIPGIEVLYNGTGTFVEFPNGNGSTVFAVLLVPSSGDPMDIRIRGPVYTKDLVKTTDFDEMLKDNPMMKAFFGDRVIDYGELEGYITVEYFSMWPLFFVIYIAIKTSTAVSKHVEDHSLDMLLSTGYTRTRFLAEKLLVIGVNVAVVTISAFAGVVVGSFLVGQSPPLIGIALNFIGSIPVCLAFVGIALVVSVLLDEGGKAVGAMLGVIIFQYIIQIVANIASWGDKLKYISLFTYWDSLELGLDHYVDPIDMLVPTVLGIGLIALSFYLFEKKEIHA